MTNDDYDIIKWKKAGLRDSIICNKLAISSQELERRWVHILREAATNQNSGYNDLCDRFTHLAAQYQLLGETLKELAEAIGSVMSEEEIQALIVPEDSVKTALNLKTQAIVLRPFHPVRTLPGMPEDEKPQPTTTNQQTETR